jgi:Domain of unknown function (DUF4398)
MCRLKLMAFAILPVVASVACGGYPPPNDRLMASVAATRSAREIGAPSSPQAALHLKLAEEEIASARALIEKNDNQRASFVLLRAKADAELALALAKANAAKAETQQVQDQIKTIQGGTP